MSNKILTDIEYEELYRDHVSFVDKEGKRVWIHPKKPKGRFYKYRTWVSWFLLAVFFSMPFIYVDGHPFMMFNVFERTFIIFGQVFFPQDFIIFGLTMLAFFVFVILFTVIYGRIWCGWVCPQTVFMEMVFRKIEYWIEGDRNQQLKLEKQPWNKEKILKKVAKHGIFMLIALLIGHTFMAYLIGLKETIKIVTQPPTEHWAGFLGVVGFSGLFYFVFSYIREQACILICPYGRLQGVLVDNDTMTVAYDYKRGEPRGKLKKGKQNGAQGDCVDCTLCVQVCPTGIDIRNGTQMECVGCTACIDACDAVMEKVGKPKGLIRYASIRSIEEGVPFHLTKRAWAYSAVLLVLLGIIGALVFGRSTTETIVLRTPGQLAQLHEDGTVSNLFNASIVNKSFDTLRVQLEVVEPRGRVELVGEKSTTMVLKPAEKREMVFFVYLDKNSIKGRKTSLKFKVRDADSGETLETVKASFFSNY
ncbi:cytochrome c oxidase accessory protein CcoG [Thermonema rossianum]|uniref:cytochrome c oxidase accessory protein CcoG n=1 Tax=Thermonema rossianum TaxID=55505 RepID=UPI00056ED8AB|nr:cytochrome c oxidase accessory protein CcoG [Thermonema rossianum]